MKNLWSLIPSIFIALFCFSFSASGKSVNPIERIEPMNWWVGMHDTTLQIVAYGQGLAEWEPKVVGQGVALDSVVRVENRNYEFLYLTISQQAKPGVVELIFNKGKQRVVHRYELLAREEHSAERGSFDASDVVYLLMPDRFANGNPANDSQPGMSEQANRQDLNGRHGGDIQGIIDHLDYLQELGITALWSTPLMEDNLPTYSYHTYAISDYYHIDPRYGTNADYKRLSKEASRKGIKLIMDVVTNHCSTEHYMVKDRPTSDWVHENKPCNFRIWTIQDPHASQADRDANLKGWFDTTMPDLNQNNALLMDYLTQNAIWWVEYAHLSGLRIDTYPYNFKEPMAKFNQRVLAEYPHLNIMGEVWMHEPVEVAYWQKDAINPDGFNSSLPTVMDFPLSDALTTFTFEKQGWEDGVMRVYKNFTRDYLYAEPNNLLIFADNHDTPRLWTRLNGEVDRFKLLFSILATVRGIPQLYYGTEIMMGGVKELGDGDIRRDFPGGWANDSVSAFTAEGRTTEQNEVFNFVQTLLQWRKTCAVIHSGKTMHYVPQDNVYVYFRYNDAQQVMVVVNNDDEESRTLDLSRYQEMLGGVRRGRDVTTGVAYVLGDSLTIAKKSALVLDLE